MLELADATEEEVLTYWQGLGYYSRARNLHAAAIGMKGVFPHTYEGVRALKGVGDYTAAAICSFAFDMPYAVVDGNVYRVLARFFNIDTPIDSTEGKKLFKTLAQEMLDLDHPANYNQAIMDFGAQQCVPKSPNCKACPLAVGCEGFRNGRVSELPVKQKRVKVRDRFFHYFFVSDADYVFLQKRSADDIWKNLYQFPLVETDVSATLEQLLAEPAYSKLFSDSVVSSVLTPHSNLRHVLSHQILHLSFYEVKLVGDLALSGSYIKVHKDEIAAYPVPRPIEIFLEKL